jgi:hypothetical protein
MRYLRKLLSARGFPVVRLDASQYASAAKPKLVI